MLSNDELNAIIEQRDPSGNPPSVAHLMHFPQLGEPVRAVTIEEAADMRRAEDALIAWEMKR